jgi:hypothetical protein
MSETVGEELFSRLCDDANIVHRRVDTVSNLGEQRPDFTIEGCTTSIVVEVKQFDPTREEAKAIEQILRGEIVVTGGVPGGRLREAIAKANGQIKALSKGMLPGLLVVYNNVFGSGYHTEPYAVLTAMRGLDVVPVRLPPDLNERPTFMPVRSGPKKKLTASANTQVSAIGVLYETQELTLRLDVFHNRHALLRLDPTELPQSQIRHFAMRDDERDWEQVAPAA